VGGSIELFRTFGFSVLKFFEIKEPLVPGFSEKNSEFQSLWFWFFNYFSEAKQPSVLGS
jgi:hypothetical protein